MAWPYVSNAEFDRTVREMNSDFLGAGALIRHLTTDIGAIDQEGRPVKGCSLWWFIAHLEPTATKITFVRKDLVDALRRGNLGSDEVQSQAFKWIGDARAMLASDGFVKPEDKTRLAKMLKAAEDAVRAWKKDPSFVGNSYFMARPSPNKEFTSQETNVTGGRLYDTKDDIWVEGNYPVASRPKGSVASTGSTGSTGSTSGRRMSSRRAQPAPSQPAAGSSLAGMPQKDAVRALLAADVLEMATGDKLPEGLVAGLTEAAAGEVADLHKIQGPRRGLFVTATSSAASQYTSNSVADARKTAQGILTELGVTGHEARAFRQNVSAGLLSAASTTGGAAAKTAAGGVPYPKQMAQLDAVAKRIKGAGGVAEADIDELRAIVGATDLATIEDGDPNLQWFFQMQIFPNVTPGSPESDALEELYYGFLEDGAKAMAAKAQAKGYMPWKDAEGALKQLACFDRGFDKPSQPADLDVVKGIIAKLDPADAKKNQSHINSMIGLLAEFSKPNEKLREDFRSLWDQVKATAEKAG